MHVPPPFVYLLVDLRWWLLALAAAAVGGRLVARRPAMRSRLAEWWRMPSISLRTEIVVAVVAVLFVTVATQRLRFSPALHGDEPKYLRFCASFYQGLGLDLTNVRTTDQIPVGEPPRVLGIMALFARAIPEELRALRGDLRAFAREGLSYRWNRARYLQNWFLQGKRGGTHQVHNPGLSFVLLPGFTIDMWFFRLHPGWNGQFSDDLFCTNLILLLIYGAWAAVALHVFTAASGTQGVGLMLTAAAMLTVPVAAMPFQIYPETLAGLVLFVLLRHLLFVDAPSRRGAFAAGLLAGALPWLHIRFIAVSLLTVVVAPLLYRRRWPLVWAFAVAYGVVLALLSFYAYHVTGSFLPTALYYSDQAPEAMEPHLIVPGILGYLFDRDYGLLSYAPIYLLALPALIPWWREDGVRAFFVSALVFALAVPSAGHSWNSAGGTPLRHLTAVVPLALLPVAHMFRRRPPIRLFWVASGLLLLLSIHNAYTYDLFHRKDIGPMLDHSVSGWKTLLLFPRVFAVEAMTRKTFVPTGLLFAWIGVALALVVTPLVRPALPGRRFVERLPVEVLTVGGLLLVAMLGLAVSAATGVAIDPNYAMR